MLARPPMPPDRLRLGVGMPDAVETFTDARCDSADRDGRFPFATRAWKTVGETGDLASRG